MVVWERGGLLALGLQLGLSTIVDRQVSFFFGTMKFTASFQFLDVSTCWLDWRGGIGAATRLAVQLPESVGDEHARRAWAAAAVVEKGTCYMGGRKAKTTRRHEHRDRQTRRI